MTTVKPDLRHAKNEEELWAARYEFRFQHRAAAYYDSGLDYVPPEARRALDAGCGSGAFAFPLAGRARMVVGLDRNFTLIALAQARQAEARLENMAWVVADVGRLPFAAGAFDFVGSYNVLHVVPLKGALAELTHSMTPGGRLVIRLPFLKSVLPTRLSGVQSFYIALRRFPKYSRAFGVGTGLRLMVQELSPVVLDLDKHMLPPEEIEAVAREQLPGCRIEKDKNTLMLFWEKR